MNNHRKVISLLSKVEHLSKDKLVSIVFEVAKRKPSLLIKIFKHLCLDETDTLEYNVLKIAKTEGKIHAIKYLREKTGKSLKDAKDYVDNLLYGYTN